MVKKFFFTTPFKILWLQLYYNTKGRERHAERSEREEQEVAREWRKRERQIREVLLSIAINALLLCTNKHSPTCSMLRSAAPPTYIQTHALGLNTLILQYEISHVMYSSLSFWRPYWWETVLFWERSLKENNPYWKTTFGGGLSLEGLSKVGIL